MADIFFDQDADLSLLDGRRVGVIGYGSQGHAHALNLRDSGVDVRVGVREGKSRISAARDGFDAADVDTIAAWADVVVLLAPDTRQPAIFDKQIAPHLDASDVLLFAHGFNIRYDTIRPTGQVDVVLVAPKAPGHRVRETYQQGEGTPALIAVFRLKLGTLALLSAAAVAGLALHALGIVAPSAP